MVISKAYRCRAAPPRLFQKAYRCRTATAVAVAARQRCGGGGAAMDISESYGPFNFVFEDETLIDFLTDVSLCNMLMSHGLRQLNIFTGWKQPNLINIAYLIVERLPHLQLIELRGCDDELLEMSHILINGLEKLNFFSFRGLCGHGKCHEKEFRNLQNSNTRSFRTDVPNTVDADTFIVWL